MSFKFNKSLGQHILKNPGVIDTIIKKANIKPTDTILEVGGGTGNLTVKLLPHCKKLICIEKDPKMAAELMKRISTTPLNKKLDLILTDILKIDLPSFDLCITNLPYQISSPFLFKLLGNKFKCAFIMFQKEFANRLIARPGSPDWCRLSVTVQLLCKVDIVLNVSRNSFNPPPEVDSSVVKILPRDKPDFDLEEFNKFVKLCFLRKNKTLKSIFKKKGEKGSLNILLDKFIMNHKIERPSKMDVEDFLELFLEFKRNKIEIN